MVLSESLILIFVAALGGVNCQRSPYASGGHSLDVLPQYTQATPVQDSGSDTLNRLGDTVDVVTTPRGPVLPGSLHDQEAINKVSNWPKEKQPFWYLNNDQLAGHRGLAATSTTTTQAPAVTSSTAQPGQSGDLGQRFGQGTRVQPPRGQPARGQPAPAGFGGADPARYPYRPRPSNPTPFPRLFRPASNPTY